jgi:hypothetical protein
MRSDLHMGQKHLPQTALVPVRRHTMQTEPALLPSSSTRTSHEGPTATGFSVKMALPLEMSRMLSRCLQSSYVIETGPSN